MCLRFKLISWKLFIAFSFENDADYLIIDIIRPWHYWTRDKRSRYELCKFYPLSDTLEVNEKGKCIKKNFGIESIKKNYWYSSVASSFNDIADCNPSLLSIINFENEYRKLARRDNVEAVSRENFKNMFVKTQLELFDTKFGITCFSNEKNFNNHLMWAHYANDHKGICVKFHPPELFSNRLLLPVMYTRRKPRISLKEIIHFLPLIKSKCWKYEKEIRLISFNIQNEDRKIPFAPSQISNIYFGCRFSENERKQEILEIINDKYPTANLAQMELNEKTIELIEKPVSIVSKGGTYKFENIKVK
jgi:hypothetical protein